MNKSIFRPIQLFLLGAITLILIALLATSWLTYREQQRLARASALLAETVAFHEQHGVVEDAVLSADLTQGTTTRTALIDEIDELIDMCSPEDTGTRALLFRLREHLSSENATVANQREATRSLLHEIALSEARFESGLLTRLRQESNAQMRYELAAPLALLTIAAIAIPLTRRRIVKPLEDFGRQMSGLADGDFTPTPDDEISEHTLPLHRNFMKLALRLQELEREQRERAESLEGEVRSATSALLEQQQSLARAERLAVAGELAASVAHEIRNPLAGIQMGLRNLRHELTDPALTERIDTVVAEVERLARLVGEIVDAARHDPEPLSVVELGPLVDELFALTRYQLPREIELTKRVQPDLRARVPKERLRQALLNLILNANTAIGPNPGRIEIALDAEGDDLRITVSDDGPGFPEALLAGGVRPFQSTGRGGTGLGLAMVRRFMRDGEGSMQLENRDGVPPRPGARVRLLLPSAIEHG